MSKVNTSMDKDSLSKLLREASSMFDDDEDHTKDNGLVERKNYIGASSTAPHQPARTPENSQMDAMFLSPDKSFVGGIAISQNSSDYEAGVNASDVSYVNGIAEGTSSTTHQQQPTNLQLIMEQANKQVDSSSTAKEPARIDIAHALATNSELLEHMKFLTSFDEEFSSRMDLGQSSEQDDAVNYEQVLLRSLNRYVHLPADVLHAMVMRQHQEIVAMGIFAEE